MRKISGQKYSDKRIVRNGMPIQAIPDKYATIKDKAVQKSISKILLVVKKSITPDKSIVKKIDATVDSINISIQKNRIAAVCVKGGSIAKDTHLKNDHDADLFVRFSMEYKDRNISALLEKVLIGISKNISRIHGSRDYFQFMKENIQYEIIPVLHVHPSNYGDIQNVTDMSPEHVAWVAKYTDVDPGLKDEIRLAKQFCKSCKVYGAESYINGFSGHIIDILIIHYGSFLGLISNFAKIKNITKECPLIIDAEKNLKNPLKELNKSKLSPLIIIDPVQPDRNSAAALGEEKLNKFMVSCRNFLENPSIDYFKIKGFNLDEEMASAVRSIRKSFKQKIKIIVFEIITSEGSKDIVGTKALKAYEEIIKHCTLNGFSVLGSGWNFQYENRSAVYYMMFDDANLSSDEERIGPPLSAKEDCDSFKNKHKDKVFVKESRLFAKLPRTFIKPEDYLKVLLDKDFIKQRIKSLRIKKITVR